MQYMTLTPAYGRDYKSKKEVMEAWTSGKDFVIADVVHPDCGRYCSIRDFENKTGTVLNIRYKKLTQVCVVKVK
jgi:hypothetical protein